MASLSLLRGEKLTLSPSVVRIDKALGTSRAVFCFFTMWMQETGITTCKSERQQTENVRKSQIQIFMEKCGEISIATRGRLKRYFTNIFFFILDFNYHDMTAYLCVLEQN